MKYIFFPLMLVSLLVKGQEKNLYQLPMGKHAIGFKVITTYDLSRSPLQISDIQGRLGKFQNEKGRQIKIYCWYPAVKSKSVMKWSDYVSELGMPASSEILSFQQGVSLYLQAINELRETELPAKELEKLYGLRLNAYKNASHEKGSFPLLLFPAYRSPTNITILSEYLASHGFIVASVGLTGSESDIPDISSEGIQSMTLDLMFAINHFRNQPFVDINKLAAMGLGINATIAFSLRAVSREVDALISLEGGILSAYEMQFLKKSAFYDPGKFTIPSLYIYAPHPSIQPNNVKELRYGDKYFIYFPKMSEHYFLDYGILEEHIPGLIGTPPGDTKKGFELGARYVLQYLNFTLNNDQSAKGEITSASVDTSYSSLGIVKHQVLAFPAIPTLTQMKNLISTQGMPAFTSIYGKAKNAEDSLPFTQQYLVDLYSWLAFRRDPDYSRRKVVAETRVELYPLSSRAHFTLANIYFQLTEKEKAIAHYSEALKLLPADQDTDLTATVKERIQAVSGENLKKLQPSN